LWPEELPNILWEYRTTARTPTRETPFRLTYGTEAVIPVEIGVTTWRTNHHDEGSNDNLLRTNLDLLDPGRSEDQGISTEDGSLLRPTCEAQGVQSWGFSAEESDPRNKRPCLKEVGAHMGRAVQSRQIPQKRHLPPGEVGRNCTTSPLERRASEEVLPVRRHS
jgi:hypothetical protein